MVPKSPLEDPIVAHHAWARYRRIMRYMALVTLVVEALVLGWLYHDNGPVSIHLYIAAALGVGVTMLVGTGLMGLVFLSNGTGHDESVIDPFADDH